MRSSFYVDTIEVIKLNNRTEIIILLDFYGNLLSEKQLSAMKSYYFNDLSLNEIAFNENVSKQAVSNLLKRAEDKLRDIELELNLVNKSNNSKAKIKKLLAYIEDTDFPADMKLGHVNFELKKILDEI